MTSSGQPGVPVPGASAAPVPPRMILSYFEDPADPFKMQMPKIYSEAKEKLDELLSLKDTAKEILQSVKSQLGGCLTWLIPIRVLQTEVPRIPEQVGGQEFWKFTFEIAESLSA